MANFALEVVRLVGVIVGHFVLPTERHDISLIRVLDSFIVSLNQQYLLQFHPRVLFLPRGL